MAPHSSVPLSVLELATVADGSAPAQALAEVTDLARRVEALGYHRLWVAEHHGMPAVASSAPAVLIAHLAAATGTIRVGSGGVMLPNHAPLVIAEQFATLEALHPGRIDLGLGRAPGTDPRTAQALRRTADLDADRFPDDLVELIGYFAGTIAHPRPVPGAGYRPEIWLLGSSLFSAELAGRLGLPFSFAHHFMPQNTEPALARYRAAFRPSAVLDRPHAMVGVAVVCAPTDDEARYLAGPAALSMVQLRTGRFGPLPTPETAAAYRYSLAEQQLVDSTTASWIVGDPDAVRAGLDDLVARTDADELIVTSRVHGYDARTRSFELLAASWGVEPPAGGRPAGAKVDGEGQPAGAAVAG
jgi:luciferase family oxidoreductase group 1